MRPLRVFLCHASQDKPAVRKLYRYLKQHGIQPWLDQEDLLPGENWEVEIPRALNNSDVILVCLSKNSINKEGYVQKEIVFALDKALEKPDGTIFIIPAKLEECEVPKRLNRFQWVDLFRSDSNKRLLLGLNKRALDLGSDISPVILEDMRQRKPAVIKPVADFDKLDRDAVENAEKAAEQAEAVRLSQEAKEKTDRETAEKIALAKLERETAEQAEIDRLAREAKEKTDREDAEKTAREKAEREAQKQETPVAERRQDRRTTKPPSSANLRWLGVGGIVLIVLFLGGFGLNYLINNLPDATPTVSSPKDTATPKSPTSTSVPFTSTPRPTKTVIPTPTLGMGSTIVSEKDGMVLVYVPAGEFIMGSGDGEADEKPIHTVDLDAFWIDQTEVTNGMFSEFVQETDYQTDAEKAGWSYVFNGSSWDKVNGADWHHPTGLGIKILADNKPVIHVSWNDALAYCEWADRRLPTEAEWEKAARGTDARTYPWGNESPNADLLNFNSNIGDTTEVGKYPGGASIYGALDMAGNVWEWVNDWYDKNYYASSPEANPLGPNLLDGPVRVLRGGSLYDNDDYVRSAYRNWNLPASTYYFFGFRCSRSP